MKEGSRHWAATRHLNSHLPRHIHEVGMQVSVLLLKSPHNIHYQDQLIEVAKVSDPKIQFSPKHRWDSKRRVAL